MTYLVFNPKKDIELANRSYPLFESVWTQTFNELGVTNENCIFSDDFINADEIGIIIKDDRVIALHIYNYHDLNSYVDLQKKVFQPYTPLSIEAMQNNKINVVQTLEYMTVDSDYRKQNGHSVSRILLGLSIENYKKSDADASLGNCYNKRKVNELCASFGAELLHQSETHSVSTDIMIFTRNNLTYPCVEIEEQINACMYDEPLKNVA